MSSQDIISVQNENAWNHVVSKVIEIAPKLNCYITISNSKTIWATLILNKIVDSIVENFTWKIDAYNSLSNTLDSVNLFLKNLKVDWTNLDNLNVLIAIEDKYDFHFSKIWEASCYLVQNLDITEVSYNDRINENFSYISSWELRSWDSIILSPVRLFDYITKTDVINACQNIEKAWDINKNLNILFNEEIPIDNIDIICINFEKSDEEEIINTKKEKSFSNSSIDFGEILEKIKTTSWNIFNKIKNSNFTQKAKNSSTLLQDKLNIKSENKNIKNAIFISWTIVSFVLLYVIISGIIWISSGTKTTALYKEKLNEATRYKNLATQNVNNPEVFSLNIEKSEELISEIKEKDLFKLQRESLLDEVNLLKKQFNWIETFNAPIEDFAYTWDLTNTIKILNKNNKLYLINKNSIIWPIINWEASWEYSFDELWNSEFIDADFDNNNIILLTSDSKIVNFSPQSTFSYLNVVWDNTWEEASLIKVYSNNIYLLNKDRNQIYKHVPVSWGYSAWEAYLKDEDALMLKTNKLNSFDIDGWIYMLKQDLTLEKLFTYPEYKIQSIVLNKLPKNYELEDKDELIKIVARAELNYVYFFFNNRIWIFKPNSRRYQDVNSLEYIGQIEWAKEKIKDIYVNYDNQIWEISVVYNNWVYKLKFDVTDEGIIIR